MNKHAFVGAGTGEIRRHISFRDEMIWERKERACHKQGRTVWRVRVHVACAWTCGVCVWGGVLGMETGPLYAKKYSDRQINVL